MPTESSPEPIELIVPYVKDGGSDRRARLLAKYLSLALDQPIEAVNRTGAVAGHAAIAQAKPDGRTLGLITGEIGMMHWHGELTDLTWRAYTPLAVPFSETAAVIVRADSPYRSLGELLDAIRTRKLKGSGGPDFGFWKFALTSLLDAAGIDWKQLAWLPTLSGEQGVEKLLAGEADIAPVTMADAKSFIFSGKLRPLAAMSKTRHAMFPDVPTVKEAIGIDWSVIAHWRGIVAPAGLSGESRHRLVAALERVSSDPGFLDECRANGFSLDWRFDREFEAYMREDDARFGKLIGQRVHPA